MSVICCGFVKLLSQFERNVSVFEGAQRLYDNFVILMTYDNCGFGNIAYLPSGKTNTYGGKNNNQKLLKYNINCIENLMHSNTLDCTIAPCTCKVIRGILSFCKKKILFLLTQCFHVFIKILAINQFPSCTKCINHIESLKCSDETQLTLNCHGVHSLSGVCGEQSPN